MLTVTHLAARGDGVVPREGLAPLYVPGTAPGDQVTLDADGAILSLIPGPHHAPARCRHYGPCGGCALQHVRDETYADWVSTRILSALTQEKITPERVHPAQISPPATRRRATWRAVRRGSGVVLGYSEERTHTLINLTECAVLMPELVALMAPLRQMLTSLLPVNGGARLTVTASETGIDLLIADSGLKLSVPVLEQLSTFAHANHLARIALSGPTGIDLIAEPRAPLLTMGGVAVRLPPNVFLQATAAGEAALVQAVQAALGPDPKKVVDLFAGIGAFSLPLARDRHVTASDAAKPALDALQTAAHRATRPLTIAHRDLFRRPFAVHELNSFDAAVIDPPRAGAIAQTEALAASTIPIIAAVSCNPNTFARDAARLLRGGYRLTDLWPVGQFLWSTHVELVARFAR